MYWYFIQIYLSRAKSWIHPTFDQSKVIIGLYLILDLTMRASTLLLVLISGLAAADQYGDSRLYPDADDTNIFREDISPGGLGRYRAYIAIHQTNAGRYKRGASTVLRAWGQLVKRTQGFRWIKLSDGFKSKTFIKIGSVEDALADFYSLKPTGVKKWGTELTGMAGNQGVKLRTPSPKYPILRLYFGNKSVRTITYVETPGQVKMALRNLEKISIP